MRDILLDQLAHADAYVAAGECAVARQRTVVNEKLRDGRSAEGSKALLAALEKSLKLALANRDRLRDELEE